MQEFDLLSDFGNQPVKEVEPEVVPISIPTEMSPAMANYYQAVGQPPYLSGLPATQQYVTPQQNKQVYSEPAAPVTPLMQEAAQVKLPEPVVMQQPIQEPTQQKFSYFRPTGSVPPGYQAAQACANCEYYDGCDRGYCSKHDFPCAAAYVCSDFEVFTKTESDLKVTQEYSEPQESHTDTLSKIRSLAEQGFLNPLSDNDWELIRSITKQRLSEQPRQEEGQQVLSEPEPAPEADTKLQKLYEEYSDVVSTFSDGELAGEVMELTSTRFSKRSMYSDAFLKMQYEKRYSAKYESLESAYSQEVTE